MWVLSRGGGGRVLSNHNTDGPRSPPAWGGRPSSMETERRAAGVVFALNREVKGQTRVLLFGRLGRETPGRGRRDFKEALRRRRRRV